MIVDIVRRGRRGHRDHRTRRHRTSSPSQTVRIEPPMPRPQQECRARHPPGGGPRARERRSRADRCSTPRARRPSRSSPGWPPSPLESGGGAGRGLSQRAGGRTGGRSADCREQATRRRGPTRYSKLAPTAGTVRAARPGARTTVRGGTPRPVGFALELAESIVRRTIECDPEVCVGQLEEAIRLLGRPTRMEVRIHPEDWEAIERVSPDGRIRLHARLTHRAGPVGRGVRRHHPGGAVDGYRRATRPRDAGMLPEPGHDPVRPGSRDPP